MHWINYHCGERTQGHHLWTLLELSREQLLNCDDATRTELSGGAVEGGTVLFPIRLNISVYFCTNTAGMLSFLGTGPGTADRIGVESRVFTFYLRRSFICAADANYNINFIRIETHMYGEHHVNHHNRLRL